jgi:hypothetical protein
MEMAAAPAMLNDPVPPLRAITGQQEGTCDRTQ